MDYFKEVLFNTIARYRNQIDDNSKCILWITCTSNKTIKWERFRPVMVSGCIMINSYGNGSVHREDGMNTTTKIRSRKKIPMFHYETRNDKYDNKCNLPAHRDNFYDMYEPLGHPPLNCIILTRIIYAFRERIIKVTSRKLHMHLLLKNTNLVSGWVFGGCKDAFTGKVKTIKEKIKNIDNHPNIYSAANYNRSMWNNYHGGQVSLFDNNPSDER